MRENKRDVYKFLLGFIEKIFLVFLVFLVSIFLPTLIGKLDVPFLISFVLSLIGITLLALIFLISVKLWMLDK